MSTPFLKILQGFHNLNGISIGDRKKEWLLLLRENDGFIETPIEIDDLIHHLKPVTYFEQKMFVDILLQFKRDKELLTIFLGGNENLIKPIWKQKCFFERVFVHFTIQSIIDDIFINLSYVARIRFLKNVIYYIDDEDKFDELYDMVLNKYGLSNAQHIFTGCSLEKKLKTLASGCIIRMSNKHIIFLHKNKRKQFQQLMELKNDYKIIDFYNYHSKAFKVIAGSDDNILSKVFKANECSVVGKKLTKKLLKNEMPYIITKASDIHRNIHRRSLLKGLKSNFEQFFFSTWPSSFKNFHLYSCLSLLRFYPKTRYVEIIQEGLQKLYNTSLSENPNLINDELLENTKNTQLRESLLELKMHESKDEYTLPKYYNIEKSIPILKKKISAADGVKTRENLLRALVNTCKINDDLDALLKIEEYFYFRHKNDDDSIRNTFIQEIKTCFDLTRLTDAHWKLILDLLKWHIMKNGTFSAGDFYMLHLKYLYRSNLTEEVLNKLLVDDGYLNAILSTFPTSWNLIDDVPELQKYFLQIFMKPLPSSSYKDNEKTELYFEFFKAILVWNKRNPSDTINYCHCLDIKESIKATLGKPCSSYSVNMDHLINFIKGKILCEDKLFVLEIEQIFWKNVADKFNTSIMEYYLRNNPLRIVEHFDEFILALKSSYMCDSVTIWRLLKHYDHLTLVKKAVEYLISSIEHNLYGTIGIGFATLIQSDEYIKFMVTHKTEMLDVNNEEQVKNYRLAVELLRYAKFNNSPKILAYIVQYCQGDSLHDALPPLYYYFHHSPEKHLLEQLQILSDRAVSVRKHAIKLACAVSPVEIVFTLIKHMTETEKNQSVLEHTYWKTFKYFLVDGSERFWILLQLQLKSLDISESNAFKRSCNIKQIPKAFRQSYLDFIWKLLDDREKEGADVSNFKESLIRSLSPEMFEELSYEFCSIFIKEKFLKIGSSSESTIISFISDCLKYCTQKELLLTDVFVVIREFKQNYILHEELKISCKSRSCLDRFVSNIFYRHNDFDFAIIKTFYDEWLKIFTPTEDIQNYIKLTLLIKLYAVNNLDTFVLNIAHLFQTFLSEFGILGMIDCFKEALYFMLPNEVFGSDDSDEKLYKLAIKLTELENSHLNLLAITLLPHNVPESQYCMEIRSKLIEIFKKSKDKSVLTNFNLYISSLDC